MDRFQWNDGTLLPREEIVFTQTGTHLYDGESKTPFEGGELTLTNFGIRWRNLSDKNRYLLLYHSFIVLAEEEPTRFAKSPKAIIHVMQTSPNRAAPGPAPKSNKSYVKVGFRDGGRSEFVQKLLGVLSRRSWEKILFGDGSPPTTTSVAKSAPKAGIVGIERKMQEKNRELDQSIVAAFADLQKLMGMAKEMVELSRTISTKIKDSKGEISEDETVQFKSYLLSLGINDPVTHDTHGTGDAYHRELAIQLASLLEEPIRESGGMMALTDVYCRVNRARGFELLSPDDLVNSCRMLEALKLPIRLYTFQSGVMVLQLCSLKNEQTVKDTTDIIEKYGSLTSDQLSQAAGISVILALERLLLCEECGTVCRDDSIEGLCFYPNLFKTKT